MRRPIRHVGETLCHVGVMWAALTPVCRKVPLECVWLPDYPYAGYGTECFVGGRQREGFGHALSCDHSVEWVTMIPLEAPARRLCSSVTGTVFAPRRVKRCGYARRSTSDCGSLPRRCLVVISHATRLDTNQLAAPVAEKVLGAI